MRYRDLLEGAVKSEFITSVIDLLTPLASTGVDSITVDQLINRMQKVPSGLKIDREMVMDLISPDSVPMIKSIEGDVINLAVTQINRSVSDGQRKAEARKIDDMAKKQAIKSATD